MKETVKEIAKGTFKKVIDPFYAGGAAELAFWLLLSLVPATILLAQLLHLFTLSMEAAHNVLGVYLSEDIYNLVAPLLDYSPQKAVTALLIILAFWSGSRAVFTLMRITNRAYDVVPKTGNPALWYVRERLRAILMTLLVLVTMVFALYILVYGELIVKASLSYSNDYLGGHYEFSDVWYGLRWVIAFALFFFMAFSIYYILPVSGVRYREHFAGRKLATVKNVLALWLKNRRRAYRKALPGSLFAAVAMLVVTWAYTIYVRYVALGNFNILYGSLSSVVVLLLWFYVMAFVVITGIQVNATYAERAFHSEA
ncbi:MAG: YihY/virulence factor BrkB family protein [Clostridiales Family XIII bacterium]|jgi:membrane protein|nr:YihY/virulence factor BrkB family protein [Clostridiales Family XIII bacterium]